MPNSIPRIESQEYLGRNISSEDLEIILLCVLSRRKSILGPTGHYELPCANLYKSVKSWLRSLISKIRDKFIAGEENSDPKFNKQPKNRERDSHFYYIQCKNWLQHTNARPWFWTWIRGRDKRRGLNAVKEHPREWQCQITGNSFPSLPTTIAGTVIHRMWMCRVCGELSAFLNKCYCANKRASIQFSASPPRTINWETSTSLSGSSLVVILLLLAARRRSQFPSFVSGKCVCFGSTQLIGVSVRVRFIFIFCGTDASVYFVRYTSILT